MSQVMEWDDSLNTGIEVIDNQHKGIVKFINQLHTVAHENNREVVGSVLMELIDYTVSHFAFEEDLQKKHGYPLAEGHKKVHDSFIKHVDDYKRRYEQGEDIALKLSGELVVWLSSHIKNEDKDYVPYCSKSLGKGLLGRMISKYFK